MISRLNTSRDQMGSVVIFVSGKTVHIHLEEVIKNGELWIISTSGETVYHDSISDSNYRIFTLKQPEGKYRMKINSNEIKTEKSFHIK